MADFWVWNRGAIINVYGDVLFYRLHFLSHVENDFERYTLSQKKQDTKLLPVTFPNVNRFSNFFHWQTQW